MYYKSLRDNFVIFVVTAAWIAVLVYPVLANKYLPFVDFPNHAARLYILANRDVLPFDTYYRFNGGYFGNSAMDLFVRLTGWQGDIFALMRWSVVFYLVNFQLAALLLYRVLWGRFSIWPLFSGLVAFSAPMYWGFQNFFVTVPLVIYVLSGWIALVKQPLLPRVLIMALPIFVIYAMHSFAFAILAVVVAGFEIELLVVNRTASISRRLFEALALTLPFCAPIFHLAAHELFSENGRASDFTSFGDLDARLMAISSITNGGTGQAIEHWVVITNSITTLIFCLPVLLLAERMPKIKFAPQTIGILAATLIGFLVAPEWLSGVWAIHYRFGLVLILLFVATTRFHSYSSNTRVLGTTFAVLLLVLKSVSLNDYAHEYSRDVVDVFKLFENVEPGAPVQRVSQGDWPKALGHFDKYASITRHAYISSFFVGTQGFSVESDQRQTALAKIQTSRCGPGLKSTGYWLARSPKNGTHNRSPKLQFVAQKGRFTLYEGCA